MKKLVFFAILCIVQQFLYGQKKEIETALARGHINNIYTINPEKIVFEDKFEKKWKKEFEAKGLEVVSVNYKKRWVYGYESECVSTITFATIAYMNKVRAFNYANEKAFGKNCNGVKDVDILFQTKKQYPDFIFQCPYTAFTKYNFKETELERFITVFSTNENKNELMNMAWENCGAVKFISIIKNYRYAENTIYNDMLSVYQKTTSVSELRNIYNAMKDAIDLLKEHVDLVRLQKLQTDYFNKDVSLCKNSIEKIESYMFYTNNKYFSKNNLDNYYTSNNDFKTLLIEINNSPLVQSPNIVNDLYKIYFDRKFSQNGVSAWKDLAVGFPAKQDEIINRTKPYVNSPVGYYKYKYSGNIKDELSSVQSTKNSLQSYINAEVPDAVTMQLAKQYMNDCYSVESKYNADLSRALAYESRLSSQVREIQNEIEHPPYNGKLPVPPYEITYQNKYSEWQVIGENHEYIDYEVTIDKDYQKKITYCIKGYWQNKYDRTFDSMGEAIVYVLRNRNLAGCWSCIKSEYDINKAEKIIEKYNKYGLAQWWKIKP